MTTLLIWLGLFASTAATDYLSAKWVDSISPWKRAHLSAVHELIGLIAGFTIFTLTADVWMIIPCVFGAWIGSFFAGVERTELDPEFVDAVADAVALINDRNSEMHGRP